MRRDSKARILVVEDEPELATEVEQTLIELGYDVVGRASSGDEAIESAEQSTPDLLLMDIRLRGERDGIDTAAEIRDRFRLPVVFMSAHTDEATLGRARRSSPYGYVVKPFTLGELWTAIEIALERHALETRLREGERWFQTTLRSIGDAILCTDVEGRVTFLNQRAEKLIGCRFDEADGRPASDVFRIVEERSRAQVGLPLDDVLRGQTPPPMREGLLLIDAAGESLPIDASVAPICDDDKVLGAVVIFRDLSDRRVLQRRLEFADRLAALGTMAAGIAHEVNNPLAVIMANLAMLSEAQTRSRASSPTPSETSAATWLDNATVGEILADAVTAADRVRRIVADLRSFTQPDDAGEGPVDVERALKWALQSTAREFRHRARVVTSFGRLSPLAGSEVRLGQVFVNLLVNAAHSIPPGQANNNEVRVTARSDSRGWAVIEVSDTGSGIPAEIRGRIFDPFFTTKPTGMGSGLGLSVCLGIVKSFGGDIFVDSEFGRGSVFRVMLPPAQAPEMRAGVAAISDGPARPRVLVIDDEPLVRRAIERSLENEHDVVSAASAAEALNIIERGDAFDLVLCDLMMPDMTGMDVAARLTRERPDVAKRMVFLSGGAFTPEAASFLAAAGRRHVEKPFRPHDLQQRVRELLAQQSKSTVA